MRGGWPRRMRSDLMHLQHEPMKQINAESTLWSQRKILLSHKTSGAILEGDMIGATARLLDQVFVALCDKTPEQK